ncbi:helix-turn-helix domain-containing protein [Metabacillus herbersteinensis]|uniref:Helix-turn-helix domain-containing protein n=1 Tax=Metabacillus herbersteinensis TaxID=283816 RepID=A0ABV6GMM5_9BACI
MITSAEIQELVRATENNKDVLVFPNDLPIHRQVKVKRIHDNFTLIELATILGCGVSTLSEIENNKRRIPYKHRERLNRYLYQEMYYDKQFIRFVDHGDV